MTSGFWGRLRKYLSSFPRAMVPSEGDLRKTAWPVALA